MLLLLRTIGAILGIAAWVVGIRKSVTLDNLRHAFPDYSERQVGQLARKSFANLGVVFFEFVFLRFAPKHKVHNGLEINNLQEIAPLISGPKGSILLSGHLGNWEWLALGCGLQVDQPLDVIIKNQRSSVAERFLARMRGRFGNRTIDAGDVRAIYRALSNKELLAILGDQAATAESVRVPFFGRDVPTFEGTARLALRTRAPILFLQPYRRTRRGYECRFHIVEFGDLTDASEANVKELTARHTALLELCIREKPEFWLWQHRRWKNA
ncbi:MAG TPA: lysophospholipid acyltransferase family protein [Candidatus Kapabacteria bacterium]|jgi:KDO2-lipid IV(A) lauroyltransferase|nr:lysophospholipid acyltransferase family protein [Candidatus Kapabacteria bacterium]